MSTEQAVRVNKGPGGWGPGLTLQVNGERSVVLSVTGGEIHPVARKIAELTGAEAINGFNTSVPEDRIMCAVINCGGTARSGIYPKKRIPTVNVFAGSPGGPLATFMTEDIFVSAVGLNQVQPIDPTSVVNSHEESTEKGATAAASTAVAADTTTRTSGGPSAEATPKKKGFSAWVVRFGTAIGSIITTLLNSGRESIKLCLNTVLPFSCYVALLIGFVNYTGLANWIARGVSPLAANPLGLILLGLITALPFLSPFLGPGAAIAQIIGVLMGTQIAQGALPVQYALPTLFAIDGQVGCDFVPVGLGLGEAQTETVDVGVPAVLFSRLITSPVAVALAYVVSFLI